MEFTGHYNKCEKCEHIFDYSDDCPECGTSEIDDISVSEIKEVIRLSNHLGAIRLIKMLKKHDDLGDFDISKILKIHTKDPNFEILFKDEGKWSAYDYQLTNMMRDLVLKYNSLVDLLDFTKASEKIV